MTKRLRAFFLMVVGVISGGALLAGPAYASTPEAEALYYEGAEAYLADDYSAALPKFTQACELKHPEACVGASLVAAKRAEASPPGEEQDRHKRAAMGFDSSACKLGIGTSCSSAALTAQQLREFALAREVSSIGCDLRDVSSCIMAGDLFQTEQGGTPDPIKAYVAYKTACLDPQIVASGSPWNKYACTQHHTWGGDVAFERGHWAAAEEIYGKACTLGIAEGCAQAGMAVRNMSNELGLDEADKYDALSKRSADYFRKGCEGGVTLVCNR